MDGFRVFDKKSNEYGQMQYFISNEGGLYQFDSVDFERLDRERYVVERFTGIWDKYNTPIYENDSVSDHVGAGVVEYVPEKAAFRVNYGDGRAKWFIDYVLSGERESIEVVK